MVNIEGRTSVLLLLDSSHQDDFNEPKMAKIQSLDRLNAGVCRIRNFENTPCNTQFWSELTYKLYTNSNVSCMRDVWGLAISLMFIINNNNNNNKGLKYLKSYFENFVTIK